MSGTVREVQGRLERPWPGQARVEAFGGIQAPGARQCHRPYGGLNLINSWRTPPKETGGDDTQSARPCIRYVRLTSARFYLLRYYGLVEMSESEILFEVMTRIGVRVRLSVAVWKTICDSKHPVMAGRDLDVHGALLEPDQIRVSRLDAHVLLFRLPNAQAAGFAWWLGG